MEPSILALWICLQEERTISMLSLWLRAPLWKRSTAHSPSTLTNKPKTNSFFEQKVKKKYSPKKAPSIYFKCTRCGFKFVKMLYLLCEIFVRRLPSMLARYGEAISAFSAGTHTSGRFFITSTSAMLKPTDDGLHTTSAISSKKAGTKMSCSSSFELNKKKVKINKLLEKTERNCLHPLTFQNCRSALMRNMVANSSRRTMMVHLLKLYWSTSRGLKWDVLSHSEKQLSAAVKS